MEETTGKYIYCVIKKPKSFNIDLDGLGGGVIHLVDFEKLAAVVSDSPVKDYPITRENTLAHQRIIEEVMQRYSPTLPVSFGTIAENSKIIQEKILKEKYNELLNALQDIKGKVEVNLKAIWLDMPKIFQKVVSENPALERVKKSLSGKILRRDEAIEIGKLVSIGVDNRKEKIKKDILSILEGAFAEYKETSLFGEQMIFNIAFLVSKHQQKSFDKIVRNLDEKYAEENIHFRYISPIPPFNFIKVPISLI